VNAPVFFASAGDERGTPQAFFDKLNAEFSFDLDAAASKDNHKCDLWFGPGSEFGEDALTADWGGLTAFLNPPYSIAGKFVAKAREEADKGATVVLLVPVRSDTKWWEDYVWDKDAYPHGQIKKTKPSQLLDGGPDGDWRPGVRGRLLPGRLKFTLTVPPELRAWIKDQNALSVEESRHFGPSAFVRDMVEATGLPKMAVERILQDYPDDKLLESAPFPSCVLIFTKV
jgi:phage N-6-adenine-methyltransferase